jgi:hypothetical protein
MELTDNRGSVPTLSRILMSYSLSLVQITGPHPGLPRAPTLCLQPTPSIRTLHHPTKMETTSFSTLLQAQPSAATPHRPTSLMRGKIMSSIQLYVPHSALRIARSMQPTAYGKMTCEIFLQNNLWKANTCTASTLLRPQLGLDRLRSLWLQRTSGFYNRALPDIS